jgi:hypothetical protein
MTPGKTGGYGVEDGFQSPAGASPGVFRVRYFTYLVSPPSGLSHSKSLTYPVRRGGRGHNYNAPSEQDFPINRPLSLNS